MQYPLAFVFLHTFIRAKHMTSRQSLVFLFSALLLTLAGRLLPHPSNFTPIMAISLATGVLLERRFLAILAGFLLMLAGDLASWQVINSNIPFNDYFLSPGILFVYAPVMLVVLAATYIKPTKPSHWLFSGFGAGMLFWIVSNFGTWLSGGLYPMTKEGLLGCYYAALPFLGNQLAADAMYSLAIFYAWRLASRSISLQHS